MEPTVSVQLLDSDGRDVTPVPVPKVYAQYLVPEDEVRVIPQGPEMVRLEIVPFGLGDGDAPDVPVGILPVLTLNPMSRQLEIVPIRLPSPKPFSNAAIDAMWLALSENPAPEHRFLRRHATWRKAHARYRQQDDDRYLPAALPDVLAAGIHLLSRWPQIEDSQTIWRSLGLTGGRESVRTTLSRIGRLPAGEINGAAVPLRTARTLGHTQDCRIGAVALVSAELARRLRNGKAEGDGLVSAVGVLRQVHHKAQPETRRADPPPSGWPTGLRHFYGLATRALAQAMADEVGEGSAPLTHLWRLYEAWVTSSVIRSLTLRLGCGPSAELFDNRSDRPTTWGVRWSLHEATIEVWSQLVLDHVPRSLCDDDTLIVRSTTAELEPDITVALRTPHDARVLFLDAKDTRKGRIPVGRVVQTGSKYLWGARVEHPTSESEVSEVIVVTCADPVDMISPDESKIRVVQAHPDMGHIDDEDLFEVLLRDLDLPATGSFDRRPPDSSGTHAKLLQRRITYAELLKQRPKERIAPDNPGR